MTVVSPLCGLFVCMSNPCLGSIFVPLDLCLYGAGGGLCAIRECFSINRKSPSIVDVLLKRVLYVFDIRYVEVLFRYQTSSIYLPFWAALLVESFSIKGCIFCTIESSHCTFVVIWILCPLSQKKKKNFYKEKNY